MRWHSVIRAAAVAAVASRLIRALAARPPLAGEARAHVPITVVVPARDEVDRIAPLLAALRAAPGVEAVIVVDDRSADRTASVAGAGGATVIPGTDPPIGWVGKTWALAQGIEAAETDWIVTLDADVVPDPALPSAAVARAIEDRLDFLSLAGRASLPRGRWLHASMLTQLVYRFGPPGATRRVANGQCMVGRRLVLLSGLRGVAGTMVEDVALARRLADSGRRVDFLDATGLMLVRPYATTGEVWTGWGRSIGLRGVESRWRQVTEVALLVVTLVVPPVRIVRRTADVVDAAAVAMRIGVLVGTRRAYAEGGISYWASPLADSVAVAAMVAGLLRRSPTWRGRRVAQPAKRPRSGARRASSARR